MKWMACLALLTLAVPAWRDGVKVWKVEPFFGSWVVVPDDSFAFTYKTGWKWLAVREARRLAGKHGGHVSIR